MPTINVIPSWNVKKLNDDQVLSGTIYANAVYKILYTRDDVQKTQVMALKEINPIVNILTNEITDYQLIPSVLFYEDGFDAGDDLEDAGILISEIVEIEREFIKYVSLDKDHRQKSTDEDPFMFNFINPKTGKPFKIFVDHDHFVGIPALTKKGDVHTNFGYINHVETDPNTGLVTRIVMDSIISTHGIFHGSTTVIPYDKLRGIYHYGIAIERHNNNIVKNDSVSSENATAND